jgi:YD repeat-containing protein
MMAIACAIFMILQVCAPVPLLALTSGPSQPEFTGFSAVGTGDMVNLFSGDLQYSIPLFELPGPGGSYPFTLSYSSGITMDQEASWVGLGWTLNAGAITREMRGLPDEYNGDIITTRTDMRPNVTWEFGIGADVELIAFSKKKSNKGVGIGLSTGIMFSHNSYMGWDAGLDLGLNLKPFASAPFGFFAGVQSSSQQGATLNTGFSLSAQKNNVESTISLGTSISGREGLMGLNLDVSVQAKDKISQKTTSAENKSQEKSGPKFKLGSPSGVYSAGISFARRSFIPSGEVRYQGGAFDATVEIGAEAGLPHIGGRVSASRSVQEIRNRGRNQFYRGYGFLHSKKRLKGQNFLNDMNRMGDGPILTSTKYLAIPNTTPDLFGVTASGLSTQFKAFRSDVGIYTDPAIQSMFTDINVGVDINAGAYADVGINLGGKVAGSATTIWPTVNTDLDLFNFTKLGLTDTLYRPAYFKIPGEPAGDYLDANDFYGDDEARRVGLNPTMYNHDATLVNKKGAVSEIEKGSRDKPEPMQTSIQHLTNREIRLPNDALTFPEYSAWIHVNGNRQQLDRTNELPHHIAGFEMVNPDGMRYIYALPVKNLEHREYVFSVANGNECESEVPAVNDYINTNEQYFQMKELPQYVHSHLLTAVIGQDYLDSDNIPGPSDGDEGYWVRFEYRKVNQHAWRAPYHNANFIEGIPLSARDDKASFVYGEREQYYLHAAESRTHKAEFITNIRSDALGAAYEFQNMTQTPASSYKLDEIRLYSKSNTPYSSEKALKRVNFEYSNGLCNGVSNGNTGKLTLTEISFSYENSYEGTFNPYKFEYHAGIENGPAFDYDTRDQDRWGRYQPSPNDCFSKEFPYTTQDSSNATNWSRAWNLKQITLPSGAVLSVDYSSDDYMYVQDRKVMQMFQITGLGSPGTNTINHPPGDGNELKVFFDDALYPVTNMQELIPYLKAIHGLKINAEGTIIENQQSQVYFKVKVRMRDNPSNEEDLYDYISGYAKVTAFGIDGGEHPFIQLAPYSLINQPFHPFAAAAWQKMKLDYPHLLSPAEFEDDPQNFRKVLGLFSAAFSQIGDIFRSYWTSCYERGVADIIEPELSMIRLSHPGLRKFGGNSRVSQISLNDNWENVVTYGQSYDYTMVDDDGRIVSSGVAENEPVVGYEDCALRYAELYPKEIPVHAREALMFEHPVNESYLPAPNIGYRKVTVRSLAGKIQKDINSPLPDNFGTSGFTTHEFYTAKDFPVIFENTDLKKHFPGGDKWTTFFGPNKSEKYLGSQGYSIILNDMHGRPKHVTHYGQDKFNIDQDQIINRTSYTYFEGDSIVVNELGKFRKHATIKNDLPALINYYPKPGSPTKMHVDNLEFGVDREFFLDMRRYESEATSVRLGLNVVFTPVVSIFGFPIPLPGGYSTFQRSTNDTRTVVANKIIRRTGMLQQVDVYDGQSHLTTSNLVFDKYSGQPVLTSVNNSYDQPIFSLNVPAHYAYNGMGASYENYRGRFTAPLNQWDECTGWHRISMPASFWQEVDFIKEGDHLLVMENSSVIETAIIERLDDQYIYLNSEGSLPNGTYNFLILRSGEKNLLENKFLNVTALVNPLDNIELGTNNANIIKANGAGEVVAMSNIMKVDKVLSARAITYHSPSSIENSQCGIYGDLIPTNFWQLSGQYNYVDVRSGVDLMPTNIVDLSSAGTVDNVPLFDPIFPFFEYGVIADKWIKSEHIVELWPKSHVSQGNDALGNSTTILYGYPIQQGDREECNLPIISAKHALPAELAYEGFEEQSWVSNNAPSFMHSSGNFSFGTDINPYRVEKYPIIGGFVSNIPSCVIAKQFDDEDIPDAIVLDLLTYYENRQLIQICDVTGTSSVIASNHDPISKYPFTEATRVEFQWPSVCPGIGIAKGHATMFYEYGNTIPCGIRSDDHAHTGKYSFLPNDTEICQQSQINLIKDRQYVIEGWIKIPDQQSAPVYPEQAYMLVSNGNSSVQVMNFGQRIEGWQRIYASFVAAGSTIYLSFISPGQDPVYYDDLRISPLEGSIMTYVYDPLTYRLLAELDNNNFATLYSYDEEGRLTQIRKETERGIMTIQESRSHIPAQ